VAEVNTCGQQVMFSPSFGETDVIQTSNEELESFLASPVPRLQAGI
jgi:hypothetical protein